MILKPFKKDRLTESINVQTYFHFIDRDITLFSNKLFFH